MGASREWLVQNGNVQKIHEGRAGTGKLALNVPWDFSGGPVAKNPPANAGDMGSIPGLGRSHMPRSS